jgi:hypothetical protein
MLLNLVSKAIKLANYNFSSAIKLIANPNNNANYTATFQAASGTVAYQEDCLNGWYYTGDTLSYSGVDGPTQTISIPGDKTTKYFYKQKLKYTQSQSFTYRFPLDSNSTDAIGGSVTGTNTNISWVTAINEGSGCASFNGTSSVISFTDSSVWKPTSQFTVLMSISTTASVLQGLVQSYSNNNSVAGWVIYMLTTGKVAVILGNNTGNSGGNYVTLISNTVINSGAVFTVALSYRNGYAQLIINGNTEAIGYLQIVYAATNYVRFGCINITGTNVNFFNGKLDNVLFMNDYALDANTIKAHGGYQNSNSITVTKYGVICTPPAYNSGSNTTTLTIYSGNDYTLTNTTISSPAINQITCPYDFPSNVEKWTYYVKYYPMVSQNPVTAGVWYNLGSQSITVPIGCWKVRATTSFLASQSAGTVSYFTIGLSRLATSMNSDSSQSVGFMTPVLGDDLRTINIQFNVETIQKISYYLIVMANGASTALISFYNGYPSAVNNNTPTILSAEFQF